MLINKTRLNDATVLEYIDKYIETGRTSFTCPLGDIHIEQIEDDFIVTMTDKYYGRLD